jgi:hypothetical protein
LLHPVWWLALGLLALNDHALKGAGLLPGVLTGKLSDLAGLFLAPPLLAALLGVRSRRGLAACYIATGGVFSAIQLSASAAGHWVALMDGVGASWQVWSDPSDLVALPMLWASWRLLTPRMTPSVGGGAGALSGVARGLRQVMKGAALSAGALLCMATSPPVEPEVERPPIQRVVWDTIEGAAFIRNATDGQVSVRVRPLADAVTPLDCAALLRDPRALVQPEALATATTWVMPADSNVALDLGSQATRKNCVAALIEGDAFSARLVVFSRSALSRVTVPGGGATPARPTVVVEALADGRLTLRGENGLMLHLPGRIDLAEVAPACLLQPDDGRLAWSDPPWSRDPFIIEDARPGVDGCLAISLRQQGTEEPLKNLWYVCMPAEDWPFEVGDSIKPTRWVSTDNQAQALTVERVGLASGEPLTESLLLTLNAGRSDNLALFGGAFVEVTPQAECPALTDRCGTAQQAAQVTITQGGERMTLRAGERGALSGGDGATVAFTVVHAHHRLLMHAGCSLGPDQSSQDVELVIIQRTPRTP